MALLPPVGSLSTSDRTLAHYDQHAQAFWNGTRDHDVSQNRDALLRHIAAPTPLRLLDFGCGPGRDLGAFRDLGHEVVGLDGAARFCQMARTYANCEVWQQDFLALDLPSDRFDGVFANAVLFHVPSVHLPGVLRALHDTLRPGGVLFASNPWGDNEEGWQGDRYGVYHSLDHWRAYVTAAGFAELDYYYRPAGQPCHRQPWLATVWRRPETLEEKY
ncbi:MAG: class I SAM-dependent methyltransferase [Immundisolibacter sp.]|uniref:class I SAM-dependent methyltransferase n=1 Tax=Immundisolibacter sp. TaxID=1934948 RepID=UPI003EE157BC